MKQMGDNEAYLLNALSTCEEPLISAGEGGAVTKVCFEHGKSCVVLDSL